MRTKTKCIIVLLFLMLLDILPLPVMGILALYIVIHQPRWFEQVVCKLYREKH